VGQAEAGDDESSAESGQAARCASRRLGLVASALCLAGVAGTVAFFKQRAYHQLRTETGTLILAEDGGGGSALGSEGKGCYTAQSGDDCYDNVKWHMQDLQNHPKWYGDLNLESTFEDFQAWVHSGSPTTCPKPCGPGGQSQPKVAAKDGATYTEKQYTKTPEDDSEEDETAEAAQSATAKADGAAAEESKGVDEAEADEEEDEEDVDETKCAKDATLLETLDASGECHQPVEGEICYASVAWGLLEGIAKHPTWYTGTGISKKSTFEELQRFLYENHPKSSCCPKPCDECRTAAEGELCHDSIVWASTEGIVKHPDWYEGTGLSTMSTSDDWQAYLQATHPKSSGCEQMPCVKRPEEVPSA
jgi:hypothetical protein